MKTDDEIAHDVYMRLKGETERQRAFRKVFSEGIDRAMFEFFKDPTIFKQFEQFKAQPHDDRLDALACAISASGLVGKRASGIFNIA